jgi:hypothetical protein
VIGVMDAGSTTSSGASNPFQSPRPSGRPQGGEGG